MNIKEILFQLEAIVASINLPKSSEQCSSDFLVLLKVKNKLSEAISLLKFSPESAIQSILLENKKEKNHD